MKVFKLLLNYSILIFLGPKKYAKYKGVKFGDSCDLLNSNWGTEPFLIELGDNVTITSGVRFVTHDGSTRLVKNNNGERYYKYGKIKVGNNCFIGINSILLPNIHLGNNCIVGAGSVVTKSFPDNSILAGNPARLITDYSSYAKKISENYSTKGDLCHPADTYKELVELFLQEQTKK